MTGWLARILVRIDGRELAPAEWLRTGWPRGVLILLVTLPALLAGPLRYLSHLASGWSLVLAIPVALLAVAPLAPAFLHRTLSTRQSLAAHAVVIAAAALAAWLPYDQAFHGLPAYTAAERVVAVDGGFHVSNYLDFVRRDPKVYLGFVSLYSLWDALHRLGSPHLVGALRLSFVFARVLVAIVPCVIAFTTLHPLREDRRAWAAGALACLAATIAVQYEVVLPLETYHLMGGFWPHLFGLVPAMALWSADALVRPRLLRLAALLAAGVLYRYTYGLNLADVFAVIGAILLGEALGRRVPAWARVALVLSVAAAAWAARYCYLLSKPLFTELGWILPHDLSLARDAELIAAAAFALAIFCRPARDPDRPGGLGRALRFPLLFAVANVLFAIQIRDRSTAPLYYAQKYDLHAVTLAASALVVATTHCVAVAVARFRRSTALLAVAVVALAATSLIALHRGFATYQEGFQEQVTGGPYRRSYPWVIPDAVDHIQRTLDREHKKFGGYVSRDWSMLVFVNALFDHRDFFYEPILTRTAGTCIFWDGGGHFPQYDRLRQGLCESYAQPPWTLLDVCSACF